MITLKKRHYGHQIKAIKDNCGRLYCIFCFRQIDENGNIIKEKPISAKTPQFCKHCGEPLIKTSYGKIFCYWCGKKPSY
jgi:NAD-dependent SIR2 family protein deacetylase